MMVVTLGRWLSMMGLLGCCILPFMPIGCANSIEQAPVRYHEQHPHSGDRLPDITVERLQACFEDHNDQIEQDSLRVGATVQVDPDGQIQRVIVTGIPEIASDFAACTRTALRNMSISPSNVFEMRRRQTSARTNGSTVPKSNEIANPAVVVEVAILLGEFIAQHGGRAVLYAVTIEVLSAAAIAGYKKLSQRCRRVKEACIISCGSSTLPTWDPSGNPFHKCLRECMERAGCFYSPP